MAASKVPSFKMNFLHKAGNVEAETSVNEKAECLLAAGQGFK